MSTAQDPIEPVQRRIDRAERAAREIQLRPDDFGAAEVGNALRHAVAALVVVAPLLRQLAMTMEEIVPKLQADVAALKVRMDGMEADA